MGADAFSQFGALEGPHNTLRRVFNVAKDDAMMENGSRGYTGSLAEKSSVSLRKEKAMTNTEAQAFVYGASGASSDDNSDGGDIEQNDKWDDNAYAVPICADGDESRKIIGYLFYGYASS